MTTTTTQHHHHYHHTSTVTMTTTTAITLTTTTTRTTSSVDSSKRARDVTCLEPLGMFFIYFSLLNTLLMKYLHYRLLATTTNGCCIHTIKLRGADRLEKRQGEGMGLETQLVLSPWYVFFIFFLRPY